MQTIIKAKLDWLYYKVELGTRTITADKRTYIIKGVSSSITHCNPISMYT